MNDQDQTNIAAIEERLATIQRSTRTLLPFFLPIHNKLRAKSKFYYNWHLTPYYKKIHYSALAVAVAFIFSLSFQKSLTPQVKAASSTCYWVGGTATWDAANVNSWASSSGGTAGTCDGGVVPGSDDTVIFDSNSGTAATVTLGAAYSPTVLGITLNKSDLTLALGANTLTISADSSTTFTFTAGTVTGDNTGDDLVASGGTSNTATFSGGTYGANVKVTSGNITLVNATFNGTTNIFTKTGTTSNYSSGGCTFGLSSTTTFYHNAASANWAFATSTGNTYNGDIKVESSNSGSLYIGDYNSTDATSVLANGKTISVGTTYGGFVAGSLYFYGFTQSGTTAQILTLTGTANVMFYGATTFAGNLAVTAPNIYLNGATFNGATNVFEKTGTATNNCTGGNTFGSSSTTTFYYNNAAATNYWVLAQTTGNTYNGNIVVENNSDGRLYVSDDSVNQAVSTLADSKTITVGAHGFTAGNLYFYGFTQTGTTAQTLTLTSAGAVIFYGGTTFNANLAVTAPRIYFNGATFNGATNSFTKTGASTATSAGGSTFAAGTSTTFTYNTTGLWRFAQNTADTYAGNVTFANNSTGSIEMAYLGTNDFGGNVTLTPGSGTISVGANGGTAQFSSASTQTLTSGGVTIPLLTHTGAGTLQLASALTSTTLTNSAGTLDLNGQNLSLTAAAAVSNDGTIKLFGSETLTNVNNLDIDSGTVIYTGNNTTNTYAIKDFGTTDYFNLSFTDANTNKIKLQVADTKTLTIAGNLVLSSGSDFFDNSTYDEAINVTGDVTMDNTKTDMGDATWTVSGSFDNYHVSTFNENAYTLVMNGDNKELFTNSTSNSLYNLTIPADTTIAVTNQSTYVYRVLNIAGTLNIPSGKFVSIYNAGSDLQLAATGKITGDGGTFSASYASKISQKLGIIDVTNFNILYNHNSSTYAIASGTYESQTVTIYGAGAADESWVPSAGTYTFNGNVTFRGRNSGALAYTINNFTNNPSFVFKGNVICENGTGTLNWTKGNGTITLSGTGAQAVNFLDKSVEAIRNSNTANTVTLTDGVTTTGLTNDSGAKLDLAGQAFGFAAASSPSNDGTIYMDGNEVLTNVNDMDITSGTVEYNGAAAYASLPNSNYFNLTFNGTGSWSLASDLNVAGNFTNTAGTFTHNNKTVTLNGTNQTITGNTTFYNLGKSVTAASTLTFAAGSTQTVTNNLNLQGASGNLLSLVSSTPATRWNLIHNASSYTASYLDITDSNHTGGADLVALSSQSTGGNNIGWAFPSYYTITSSSQTTATTTAGTGIPVVLVMKDSNGNTVNTTSDVPLTFSGLNTSANSWVPTATDKIGTAIQFGAATTITLTNGIGTTTITPYKTETSNITATDTNSLTTTTPLALTVSRPTVSVSINTPPAAEASGGLSASTTPMPSDKYLASPNITALVTLSSTNGTATSGSSIPSYRLAESSAALSSATPQTFTANPLLHITYNLEPTSGYHTLYGTATDTYGNTTATTSSQTVQLDAAAPTAIGNLQAINVSDTTSPEKIYATALVFTPSTDDGSGLLGYAISKDGTLLEPQTNPSYTSPYEGEAGWGQTITNPNTIQQTTDKDNKLGNGSGTEYAFYIDTTNKESTKYTYSLQAIDNAGNISDTVTVDETGKVTTTTTTTLTQISDLKVEYSQSAGQQDSRTANQQDSSSAGQQGSITAVVSFTTDAPATSTVSYGTDPSTPLGAGQNNQSADQLISESANQQDSVSYNTSHTLTITDLAPDTTYYFTATATDQNKHEVTATSSSTSPSIKEDQPLFETIWGHIESFFGTIWHTIRNLFTGNLAQSAKSNKWQVASEQVTNNTLAYGSVGQGSPWYLQAKAWATDLVDHALACSPLNKLKLGLQHLFLSHSALAADTSTIKDLHVVPAYDKNNKFVGKAIYWPPAASASGDLAATYVVKKDGVTLATATTNNYLDLTATETTNSTYQANTASGKITETIPGGTPQITDLFINAIAITETSINVEVSWLTSGVPSSSKVSYGTVAGSYDQETNKDTLDESHKVIINNLDPSQTYYFQASSTSNTQETSVSQEASYTVPETQKAKSVFVVIYEALAGFFGKFIRWMRR